MTFKALAGLLALPLAACATANAPSRDEVDGLRAEVAELRARQAAQDRELEALRERLPDAGAQAVSAPVASQSTTRAEGANTVEASGPRVPENLKVVYVAPDPVVLDDGAAARRAPPAPRHRAVAAPTPLPVDTELREPVSADQVLSPEALEVAYKAALASPEVEGAAPLERFAAEHPDAPQADNALFEAGLRHEREGHAELAARDFRRAVDEHPAGDTVADSLLHLAACQLQLHQNDAARQTLARIARQFPGSAQAEAAQSRLADLGG